MPAADDLFRPTAVPDQPEDAAPEVVELPTTKETPAKPKGRTASGRVKHDEKMTVYVTSDELIDLEHARLELRRHHGIAADRGRIVRAAIAMALADLDAHGEDSSLVRRLTEA
ncbi:hypothetical protein [Nocardioides caldifontis]|uniref:hypothetical protein n=1 Tax=Nocardioides caldifontis TaxID=2588938 RepID=UPI003B84AD01